MNKKSIKEKYNVSEKEIQEIEDSTAIEWFLNATDDHLDDKEYKAICQKAIILEKAHLVTFYKLGVEHTIKDFLSVKNYEEFSTTLLKKVNEIIKETSNIK